MYWSSETIKAQQEEHKLIDPYCEEAVKHGAYELALGGNFFITSSENGVADTYEEGKQIRIPPGQFGLLITQEEVSVPCDAIAFISIRSKVKFQGLVNVSGFHVDPGFRGKLKFSVYNAGSQAAVLSVGDRIFMIWYAKLDKPTDGYQGDSKKHSEITSNNVRDLQGEIASPGALKELFDELKKDYKEQHADLKRDYQSQLESLTKDVTLWRQITITMGVAIVMMILGAVFRPVFDQSKSSEGVATPTVRTAPLSTATPRPTANSSNSTVKSRP